MHLVGALHGADLEGAYAAADLLVLPSHVETYGMVVTEALAHGLPVVATAVGGLPEALGEDLGGPDDGRPGLLVPPGRPEELADTLRSWLTDGDLRERLRRRALRRRLRLSPWSRTVEDVSAVLDRGGEPLNPIGAAGVVTIKGVAAEGVEQMQRDRSWVGPLAGLMIVALLV